jgi:HEAT repeat protein
MFAAEVYQDQDQKISPLFPLDEAIQIDGNTAQLLSELEPSVPWGKRQAAARKIGYLLCSDAVPALTAALTKDPFWMVRCSIIQALEKIGDPRAVGVLIYVAEQDSFQVVRAHAEKAIQRILQEA